MVNATQEELVFDSSLGDVPNRGNLQDDIKIHGVNYIQTIDDANGGGPLHSEPGQWLFVPRTTVPDLGPTIVRLSTVPHGNSIMAQGHPIPEFLGSPIIGVTSTIPFTLGPDGSRIDDPNKETYLKPYFTTPEPPGLPKGCILDPNLVLKEAIKGQKIIKTLVLFVNATPVGGINETPISPTPSKEGNISNIPFLLPNANANSMSAIFWIEWVDAGDGKVFLQLQYTQTVILDFPVPGPDGKMMDIKWPHISVGTLIKR